MSGNSSSDAEQRTCQRRVLDVVGRTADSGAVGGVGEGCLERGDGDALGCSRSTHCLSRWARVKNWWLLRAFAPYFSTKLYHMG
jgi:hypothetical protein